MQPSATAQSTNSQRAYILTEKGRVHTAVLRLVEHWDAIPERHQRAIANTIVVLARTYARPASRRAV